MRIGLLTGGGDCPGLNAAIRAVVRVATAAGDEVVGFHHGWLGVVDGDAAILTKAETKGILQSGGTILRTARYHPDEHEGGVSAVLSTVDRHQLDALIVIGGDGTLGSASRLARSGVPIVGIPKTIDNDVAGTNRCIGFDTAVATAADAIDRVQTTGESHDRLMVVEVMGRTTGWLAISAGIAAGADAICAPEDITDLDALAKAIRQRHDTGSSSSIVVVAEGARVLDLSEQPKGSMGALVTTGLADRTGYETRLTVLGHIQRGGTPTAADRLLATSFGVAAVEAVHTQSFGSLVCALDDRPQLTSLDAVEEGPRPVPAGLLDVARKLTVGW
jgi:ATP-dependent phosphofructokinase / diphosphate-dependent phosphofructokinase